MPCAIFCYCANRQSPVEGRRYSRGIFRLPRAAGRFAAEVRSSRDFAANTRYFGETGRKIYLRE